MDRYRWLLVPTGLALLAIAAAGLAFSVLAVWSGESSGSRGMDVFVGGLFVTVLFVLPFALGVLFVWLGDRALFGRVGVGARDAVIALGNPRTWLGLLKNSVGRAFLAALVAPIIRLAAGGEAAGFAAFLALTAYSFIDPVATVFQRGLWFGWAVLSAVCWVALFLEGVAFAEPMREGAMVFLFPMMAYPAVMAVAGLARLGLRHSRVLADPAAPGQSEPVAQGATPTTGA